MNDILYIKQSVKELTPYKVVPQEVWNNPQGSLKLDWNEATIPISNKVKEALLDAIKDTNLHWYPNVANDVLLTKLANYVGLTKDSILYFASSDSAQEYIARTFLESFDDILILGPTYDNFRVTCQSESYHIHFCYMNENLDVDWILFHKMVKEISPKLIYISNPNNPTGTCYTIEQVKSLLEEYPGTMFLIDEAYIEFSLYESCKHLVIDYKNIIISRTFSKAFGLAGFRIGYIIGNPVILEFIGRIRNPKAVTTLTQIAAMTALDDVDYMYRYVDMVLKAKRYFETELSLLKIDYKTGGGNFVLIKIPQTKSFIKYLRERDVYVRDYTHIDKLNGFDCRVTIGTQEQMIIVVNFIKEYLNAKTCNI